MMLRVVLSFYFAQLADPPILITTNGDRYGGRSKPSLKLHASRTKGRARMRSKG
jgi:hypothetical protein